ncbi:MAG: hypothetical protein KIT31_15220 [Deltaproteobacteria bacterium]|nr:hypothetical protein [Deltaproteobacteria bacterium]
MMLVVAEKPSVARDFARVLGVRATGRHAFEGDSVVITWCVGHLVELEEPAAYDPRWRSWRLDTLPMLPEEFRLRPAPHGVQQLRAVAKLLCERRFRTIVNACDAGREGELIFRYVYQWAGARTPVQRLWVSSLTDDAVRRGFAALEPSARFDPLADAARSRSEADWLVGMNATRAITAKRRDGGGDTLYSIGRVQTPTLAMLVSREQAIREFVPRDYWEVRGDFTTAAGERFSAGWRARVGRDLVARIGAAALAEEVVARDAAHGAAADAHGPRVERVRARTVREPPPLLFDLTSLQRTANRRFGFSASRTLELAQALYERHKVLTYPRTDARYLTSDMVGELPALFAALAGLAAYAPFAAPLVASGVQPGRRVVDDTKVGDHHAIIPTANAERAGNLDRDEQRIFDLVVRRFLGAFYPDAELAVTEAWIRVAPGKTEAPALPEAKKEAAPPVADGERPVLEELPPPPDRYLARGRVRLVAGWQDVAGIGPAGTNEAARARRGEDDGGRDGRDGDGDEPMGALPRLAEGQALDGAFAAVAKQTRPPPRYTEATLLGAMESAGKTIDDEALRAAMRDRGLGTPATRASIIETLLRRDYIVRERQHLVPTATGIDLIRALPVASLASPELTGAWEQRLARVARNEETRAAFMADIARYVAETVDAIRTSPRSPHAPPTAPPHAPPTAPPHAPPTAPPHAPPTAPPHAPPAAPAPELARTFSGRPRDGVPRPAAAERIKPAPAARRTDPATWGDLDMVAAEQLERTASPFATTLPGTRRRKSRKSAASDPRRTSSAGRRGKRADRRNAADDRRSSTSTGARRGAADDRRSSTSTGARRGAADDRRSSGAADDRRSSTSTGAPRGAVDDRADARNFERRGPAASASRLDPRRIDPRDLAAIDALVRRSAPAVADDRGRDHPLKTTVFDPRAKAPAGTPATKARAEAKVDGAAVAEKAGAASDGGVATAADSAHGDATGDALGCPRCRQGELIAGQRGWGCSRWREGCRFVIWFETAGRRLTTAQLRDLVTRGKTRKTRFRPDGGGPTDGRLVLDAQRDNGSAVFEPA